MNIHIYKEFNTFVTFYVAFLFTSCITSKKMYHENKFIGKSSIYDSS